MVIYSDFVVQNYQVLWIFYYISNDMNLQQFIFNGIQQNIESYLTYIKFNIQPIYKENNISIIFSIFKIFFDMFWAIIAAIVKIFNCQEIPVQQNVLISNWIWNIFKLIAVINMCNFRNKWRTELQFSMTKLTIKVIKSFLPAMKHNKILKSLWKCIRKKPFWSSWYLPHCCCWRPVHCRKLLRKFSLIANQKPEIAPVATKTQILHPKQLLMRPLLLPEHEILYQDLLYSRTEMRPYIFSFHEQHIERLLLLFVSALFKIIRVLVLSSFFFLFSFDNLLNCTKFMTEPATFRCYFCMLYVFCFYWISYGWMISTLCWQYIWICIQLNAFMWIQVIQISALGVIFYYMNIFLVNKLIKIMNH